MGQACSESQRAYLGRPVPLRCELQPHWGEWLEGPGVRRSHSRGGRGSSHEGRHSTTRSEPKAGGTSRASRIVRIGRRLAGRGRGSRSGTTRGLSSSQRGLSTRARGRQQEYHPDVRLNRRMRTRMYGGVRGGAGDPLLLLDSLFDASFCE
jgi:hypothetical protein